MGFSGFPDPIKDDAAQLCCFLWNETRERETSDFSFFRFYSSFIQSIKDLAKVV